MNDTTAEAFARLREAAMELVAAFRLAVSANLGFVARVFSILADLVMPEDVDDDEEETEDPEEWLLSLRRDYHEPGDDENCLADDCYWCWVELSVGSDDE